MTSKSLSISMIVLAVLLIISLITLVILLKLGMGDTEPPEMAVGTPPSTEGPPPQNPEPTFGGHEDDNLLEASVSEEPAPQNDDPENPEIWEIISSMTLREKICQMMIVLPDTLTNTADTNFPGKTTENSLEKYPVGGLVFLAENITSEAQITDFNQKVQTYSNIGLFLASDEEGGRVGRLQSTLNAYDLEAMFEYRGDGGETAYNNAVTIARALKQYGFNMNLAPVADVLTNPDNTVIGDRAYSDNYAQAADLVSEAVRGFGDENIISVLKHFPGHGSTEEDSHNGKAYVNKTIDKLRAEDFLPFISGIGGGADMVMLGHLIVNSIDGYPATLSQTIVTNILRNELGFDGVIITDAMAMKAISENYSVRESAVGAIIAGVDIIFAPTSMDEVISAVENAVSAGEITEKRLDESIYRILRVKLERGILTLDGRG